MIKRIGLLVAYAALAFAIFGTSVGSRQFVKIQIGPIYILEILLMIFVASAIVSDPHVAWKRYLRLLWPTVLFFLWGAILLTVDVVQNYHLLTPYLVQRIAQHGILFVYPLAWMAVGAWAYDHFDSRWIDWLIVAMVVLGARVHNISLGPIILIPALYYLVRSQGTNVPSLRKVYLSLALLLEFIAFYPFWEMYTDYMQRTSLLLLFVLLFGVPWFCCPPRNIAIPLKSIALSLALFLAGIVIVSSRNAAPSVLPDASQPNLPSAPQPILPTSLRQPRIAPPTTSPPRSPTPPASAVLKARPLDVPKPATFSSRGLSKLTKLRSAIVDNGLKSLQHGEDKPSAADPTLFQFRMRKFMWQTALADWRHNRVFGVGFIPEVPSYLRPSFPNAGGFEFTNDPPVSGPHNSYLSVLVRMGIIGCILFLVVVLQTCWNVWHLHQAESIGFTGLFLIFVPLNGALHAVFNVGFESPHRCLLMWVFMGFLCFRASNINPVKYAPLHRP